MTYHFEVDKNGDFHRVEDPPKKVDMVCVVRCKDCKHGIEANYSLKENKIVNVTCEYGNAHDPDFFCADGRKKDDG